MREKSAEAMPEIPKMPQAPACDGSLLYLPPVAEAWDVVTEASPYSLVSVRPGLYRLEGPPPDWARMLRTTSWKAIEKVDRLEETGASPLQVADDPVEPPIVALSTVDSHYLEGEPIEVRTLPAADGFHELLIRRADSGAAVERRLVQGNAASLPKLEAGTYLLRTRWLRPVERWDADAQPWSPWSLPLSVTVHPPDDEEAARELRVFEHRLSLQTDRDARGLLTVTDPFALPPRCPVDGGVRWFRTPCYEGSGPLLNELEDYYRDPFRYYLSAVETLVERGFEFCTWHDLLDAPDRVSERAIVLQFDVDAGPKSFARLFRELQPLGVRASVMLHARASGWYSYTLDDLDLSAFADAEAHGWTIGYHNNSIGNVQEPGMAGDFSDELLAEAARAFHEDVQELRRHFEIRVFTHHGGNSQNTRTPVPPESRVTCVDQHANPTLWAGMTGGFSDGGFVANPEPFAQYVSGLGEGRWFVRNHPLKYGNYEVDFDVPPLVPEDIERVGGTVTDALRAESADVAERQDRWLSDRLEHRMGQRLTRASHRKPITQGLGRREDVTEVVEGLYASRGAWYVRQSPWMWGDPRVYWWRVLDAHAPEEGRILNVGALSPDHRVETTAFTGKAEVLEMDIDPEIEPHILADITNPPRDLIGTFNAVLLYGLTIIHSPSRAVDACRALVKPGGIVLFGFAADTHPIRGGLWDPVMRPLWAREREPLANIGFRGFAWSFDEQAVHTLFSGWESYAYEFYSHMFFVVARPGG